MDEEGARRVLAVGETEGGLEAAVDLGEDSGPLARGPGVARVGFAAVGRLDAELGVAIGSLEGRARRAGEGRREAVEEEGGVRREVLVPARKGVFERRKRDGTRTIASRRRRSGRRRRRRGSSCTLRRLRGRPSRRPPRRGRATKAVRGRSGARGARGRRRGRSGRARGRARRRSARATGGSWPHDRGPGCSCARASLAPTSPRCGRRRP